MRVRIKPLFISGFNMTKILDKLGIFAFLLGLSLPLLVHLFGSFIGTQNSNLNEKRRLSTIPEFSSIIRPAEFTDELSGFLDDNFGLRHYFIRAKRWIEISVNGRTNNVASGTLNPWLFLKGAEAEAQYAGRPYLNNAQMSAWNTRLRTLEVNLEKQNIQFLSVKIPGKARLYPEYVPNAFGTFSQNLPDQGLNFDLALEPYFRDVKASGANLFYATDTHWNMSGVKLAFDKISKHIGSVPDPVDAPEFRDDLSTDFIGDLVTFAGLDPSRYRPPHKRQIISNVPATTLEVRAFENIHFNTLIHSHEAAPKQTLVIIGDSFSMRLVPLFLFSYKKVVHIHHRFGDFSEAEILEHNPDLVLFMPSGANSYSALMGEFGR